MPVPPSGTSKPRKPRPSRAKGLRTTTGCLTCRKRRVKCDEKKPQCSQCSKAERVCIYGDIASPRTTLAADVGGAKADIPSAEASDSANTTSPAARAAINGDIDPQLFSYSPELRFDLSPLTLTASLPSPNSAPFEWYDLLAEDAINNIQKHNLGFDEICLSRRQTPVPESPVTEPLTQSPSQVRLHPESSTLEPWNSTETISLTENELPLFQHFVDILGPTLDLFDPLRTFSIIVPRLAVHNVGLLKSLLAVAARHIALNTETYLQHPSHGVQTRRPNTSDSYDENEHSIELSHAATQYYYETLRYLSQNLLYPSYTKSGEIIATAILISTYEMFDSHGSCSNGDWERHLRGIFWIQRSQDNNGESLDGLRRGAWWAWLRQDIWVALRESRRVLTIWRPTKRLVDLSPDELATRILYIAARCVDYAANEKHYDVNIRIEQGDKLLQALGDWHRALPASFQPIYAQAPSESVLFGPVWIHPAPYAAAMQTFHFARIIVLINQPSVGGINAFRQRQRLLDESVETICGIAVLHRQKDLPSTFVDAIAIYAAGLCVQTHAKQNAILQLLEKTLEISKFPPKSILNDLTNFWREES
ncbi:hypothetical protein CC78DRAFT_452857 [Lojkania enalia]|uniref:Zn(2)-C6 fungal-type domain-containing protein n=1 Tax=Lojkania enalia TaxID=147567 RepID=A0A9P4TQV1_9PLEO|nr:hypothetical protein CC78DRAFT_452857 [Didymosphaeria enalia]